MHRVLIVAGSDSGGGAGIQADIKTVTLLGGYAATAITALTAQNTRGVKEVLPVDPWFIEQQMEAVLEDIGADAVKTGMLHSGVVVRSVARQIQVAGRIPLVVDPVMVATSGDSLMASGGLSPDSVPRALTEVLLPMAAVVTPNVPEAEILTGLTIESREEMGLAADLLLARGVGAVLLKGGHLQGEEVHDLLRTADGDELWLSAPRIETRSTHGTGCTLASAVAAGVAEGLTLKSSVERAHGYVRKAIELAPGLGTGNGPLNHGHPLQREL